MHFSAQIEKCTQVFGPKMLFKSRKFTTFLQYEENSFSQTVKKEMILVPAAAPSHSRKLEVFIFCRQENCRPSWSETANQTNLCWSTGRRPVFDFDSYRVGALSLRRVTCPDVKSSCDFPIVARSAKSVVGFHADSESLEPARTNREEEITSITASTPVTTDQPRKSLAVVMLVGAAT